MRPAACVVFLACSVAAALGGSLDFVVIGDWGGSENFPYYTLGEVATAKAMNTVAGNVKSQFTLGLGDNMYSHGVKNENDPRFKHTFEDVFKGDHLQSTWHMTLGNHDHYGNATAQVAYTRHSKRWSLPDFYYSFSETFQGTSREYKVDFVIIDTVIVAGNVDDLPDGSPAPGPADFFLAETQWEWIEATLANSTADFLIVAGHYPVWSIGEHGPTADLVQKLKPLLEKYKVNAYLCGHDHSEQYLDEGKGVQYHVIGAAHGTDNDTPHAKSVPAGASKFHWASGTSGFGSVHIDEAGMQVTHWSNAVKALLKAPVSLPRAKAGPEMIMLA